MQKISLLGAALALAIVLGLLTLGCTAPEVQNQAANASQTLPEAKNISSDLSSKNISEVKNMSPAKNPIVVFETAKGTFKAEIFVKEAPITGANFMNLVRSGFYDNLTFHRVEPGFVVQGGDPKGDGTGGSGKNIPLEIKPNLRHSIGSLAMARAQDPNSASSQFYIVTGEASFLDGQYAVFGKVLGNGMEVVQKIKVGDRMAKVYEEK